MKRLEGRWKVRLFLRSLLVQGSWSYKYMQGLGLYYVIGPWLERKGSDPVSRSSKRTLALFNTHPYMASYAVGVLARLEEDDPGSSPAAKSALMGPLGALGDNLFWAAWRPLVLILGLLVAFLSPAAAVLLVLLIYNALHLRTRWVLQDDGYRNADVSLERLVERADQQGAAWFHRLLPPMIGTLLGLASFRTGSPGTILFLFMLCLFPQMKRRNEMAILLTVVAVAVLLGRLGIRTELPWFPLK